MYATRVKPKFTAPSMRWRAQMGTCHVTACIGELGDEYAPHQWSPWWGWGGVGWGGGNAWEGRKELSERITTLHVWIVVVVTQLYKFVDSSKYILKMSGSCM